MLLTKATRGIQVSGIHSHREGGPGPWAELTGWSGTCSLHCEDSASQEILFQGPCPGSASKAGTAALLRALAPSQRMSKRLSACLPTAPNRNVIFVKLNPQRKPPDPRAILSPPYSREPRHPLLSGRSGLSLWELGKEFLPDPCGRRKVLFLALPRHCANTFKGLWKHPFMTRVIGAPI